MSETFDTVRDYTGVTTEQIVVEMLTENTGRGLCDSGDHYGRNWSLNQGKVFADEPQVRCTFEAWKEKDGNNRLEASATISLYHWMVSCLDFDPEMQAELDEFVAREENEDEGWLAIQEQFAEYLHERDGHEEMPSAINTYNFNDWDCSQVLQYVELYLEDSYEPSHLIVSVHGGCDIRGGYTAPKCFKLTEEYSQALDKACVKTFEAGEFWWDCWGPCEAHEAHEDAPCPDIFTAPCFKLDDVIEDCPELGSMQVLIDSVSHQIKLLACTDKPLEAQAAMAETMTQNAKAMALDLVDKAATHLSTQHDVCTFVHDRRLYLIYTDDSGLALCEEVTAYTNL